MAKPEQKPEDEASPEMDADPAPQPAAIPPELAEELDEEEAEFRAIRKDLPGVKGASAAGIVAISVGKTPTKNEFFRSHKTFRPTVPLVDHDVGMEKQFFAVNTDMVEPLNAIGITVTDHVLYLTITTCGAYRIVPVRQANVDGEQNEYNRTKEIGLMQGIDERLYTDQENRCYKVFPAPVGRFGEPQWPDLKQSKIFRLAFRDKSRLIDSVEHPLFKKWAARDSDELPYDEIWPFDFEFVSRPGEHPDVVCLVARELRSGQTIRLWRDTPQTVWPHPPYRTDKRVLFVSFVANAECACHLALGWPLPARILDLSPAFRNLTNGRYTPEGKGLLGALRYYGLDTINPKQKDAMQKRVMQGWPFTPEEQTKILDYCAGDVDDLVRLLLKILVDQFDLGVALYHGEFAAVSAMMEHSGVPIG